MATKTQAMLELGLYAVLFIMGLIAGGHQVAKAMAASDGIDLIELASGVLLLVCVVGVAISKVRQMIALIRNNSGGGAHA